MRWLIALLLTVPLGAQELTVPCEASPETLKTLEALPPSKDFSLPYETRIGGLRTLAEQHPDDFFLQIAYQDAFRRGGFLGAEYDRALEMYRKRGSSPLARYLEARLLILARPEQAKAVFAELAAKHPKFVWPQVDMLEWGNLPGRRDAREAESHVRAFLAACPGAPEIYQNFGIVGDPQLLKQGAENLRNLLVRRHSRLDLTLWLQLWTLESRVDVESAVLAQRIRGDLARLGALPFQPLPEWYWLYRQASETLKDPGVMKAFEERVAREAPGSALMQTLEEATWWRQNPQPGPDATRDERQAFDAKHKQAVAGWRKRWPQDCHLIQQQWLELPLHGEDSRPDAEILRLADEMMQCRQRVPDFGMSVPPIQTLVARVYVDRKVRLDQVPRLLEEGMHAQDLQERYRLSQELMPGAIEGRFRASNRDLANARTQETRVDYYLAINRPAEARSLIEQELAKLEAGKPEAGAGPREAQQYRYSHGQWMIRLGKVNEKENRIEEALSCYQAGLEGWSKGALEGKNNPILGSIKSFYISHGGTEEKWLAWASERTTEAWQRTPAEFIEQLPEFSAADLAGHTWRLADLKGKATLVNFWATWCEPCRAEHAEIQKLYDRLKDRTNLQVLTLSVDQSASVAKAYIKEKGYTFPVIYGPELADRLFPYGGLPTNLLVNPEGRRTSLYGFGWGAGSLQRTIADMEKAASVR